MKRLILLLLLLLAGFTHAQNPALIASEYTVVVTTEYDDILAYATLQGYTAPSAGQQVVQRALIDDLKTDGVWDQVDILYIPANDGSKEFGEINWKDPDNFELLEVGDVWWIANKGILSASLSNYYKTGWIASTNATYASLDDINASVYVTEEGSFLDDSQYYLGAGDTDQFTLALQYYHPADDTQGRANTGSYVGGGTTGRAKGLFMVDRITSTNQKVIIGGIVEDNDADASSTLSNVEMYLLLANNGLGTPINKSDATLGYISIGGSLEAEDAALNTLISTYISDIAEINATFETTSSNATWSPDGIINTGSTLHWEARGTGIADLDADANDPTFDFSANTGNDPIVITVTSADDLVNWTKVDIGWDKLSKADITEVPSLDKVWLWGDDLMTYVNLDKQTSLTELWLRDMNITLMPNVSGFTSMINMDLLGNPFTNTSIDVSGMTVIERLGVGNIPNLATLDISNNVWIDYLLMRGSNFSATTNGNAINNLSNFLLPHGQVEVNALGTDSFIGHNSLYLRGWTMVVDADPLPDLSLTGLGISQVSDRMTDRSFRMTGSDITKDGLFAVVTSDYPDEISYYHLTTPHDLSTFTYDGYIDTAVVLGGSPSGQDIIYGDDDDQVYHVDLGVDGVHVFSMTTKGDMSTNTYDHYYNPPNTVNDMCISFNDDGTTLFMGAYQTGFIDEYAVTTAWDLSGTVTYQGTDQMSAAESTAQNSHHLTFLNGGRSVFYRDNIAYSNNSINFGRLSTAWDLSTLTKDEASVNFTLTGPIAGMLGMKFKNDPVDGAYFFNGSYSKDHMDKFRFYADDDYTEGIDYYNFVGDRRNFIVSPVTFKQDLPNAVSMVALVKIGLNTGEATLEIAGSTSSNYLRFDYDENTDVIYVQLYDGTNSALILSANNTPFVNDGGWHQIAFTYDSTSGIDAYFDGTHIENKAQASFAGWGTGGIDSYRTVYIGQRDNGGSWFKGDYAGLQIYSDRLTATEITNIAADFSTTYTNLVANYQGTKGRYFWQDETSNNYHAGVESVDAVIDYFNIANAAHGLDEANSVANWTDDRLGVATVESSDVFSGDYAVKVTSGANTYSNAYYTVTGLEVGATYSVKMWAKSGTYNASSAQQLHLATSGGWETSRETSVTTSTWTEYTIADTRATATTGLLSVRANRNVATAGQTLFVDDITVRKIEFPELMVCGGMNCQSNWSIDTGDDTDWTYDDIDATYIGTTDDSSTNKTIIYDLNLFTASQDYVLEFYVTGDTTTRSHLITLVGGGESTQTINTGTYTLGWNRVEFTATAASRYMYISMRGLGEMNIARFSLKER